MFRDLANAPSTFAYLAHTERLRFLELFDAAGPYAHAAVCQRGEVLELHLEVLRFGPSAVRGMGRDLADFAQRARAAGVRRIVGLRLESGDRPDPRWAKFTRLFGFTGQRVLQAAELDLGPGGGEAVNAKE